MINEDRVPEKALDELVGLWKVRKMLFLHKTGFTHLYDIINDIIITFIGRNSR